MGHEIWNKPVTYKQGTAYCGAGFTIKPVFDDHIGSLEIIDPVSGKIVWEIKNKSPLWGEVLTKAGGPVFCGTLDGFLEALDAKIGEEVWKFQVGPGIVASPVTLTASHGSLSGSRPDGAARCRSGLARLPLDAGINQVASRRSERPTAFPSRKRADGHEDRAEGEVRGAGAAVFL